MTELDLDDIERMAAGGGTIWNEQLLEAVPLLIGRIRRLESEAAERLSDPAKNELGGFRGKDEPDTSRAAALAAYPRTGTQRLAVLAALAEGGPMTDEKISERLSHRGYASSGIRTRRSELVKGGWVRDSGRRRLTLRGSESVVWELTDSAKARLPRTVV